MKQAQQGGLGARAPHAWSIGYMLVKSPIYRNNFFINYVQQRGLKKFFENFSKSKNKLYQKICFSQNDQEVLKRGKNQNKTDACFWGGFDYP